MEGHVTGNEDFSFFVYETDQIVTCDVFSFLVFKPKNKVSPDKLFLARPESAFVTYLDHSVTMHGKRWLACRSALVRSPGTMHTQAMSMSYDSPCPLEHRTERLFTLTRSTATHQSPIIHAVESDRVRVRPFKGWGLKQMALAWFCPLSNAWSFPFHGHLWRVQSTMSQVPSESWPLSLDV